MKIKVINRSAFELPHYETVSAAGLDVRANTTESAAGWPPNTAFQ